MEVALVDLKISSPVRISCPVWNQVLCRKSLFYKRNNDGGLNLSSWFVCSGSFDSKWWKIHQNKFCAAKKESQPAGKGERGIIDWLELNRPVNTFTFYIKVHDWPLLWESTLASAADWFTGMQTCKLFIDHTRVKGEAWMSGSRNLWFCLTKSDLLGAYWSRTQELLGG